MPVIKVTPTISTSAYSSGDVVGGKMTIEGANGLRGLLTHISVYDADGEGVQLDFFFFDADLEGTYTDNDAFAIAADDISKWIGVVSIATSDYYAAGSDKVATIRPHLVIERGSNGEENLYAICVIRSATTYTAVSDLKFQFGYVT